MHYSAIQVKDSRYASFDSHAPFESSPVISCDWQALRGQLLLQWKRLTAREIDKIGPHRKSLAALIQQKYGIAAELIENYLMNFERTMPARLQ